MCIPYHKPQGSGENAVVPVKPPRSGWVKHTVDGLFSKNAPGTSVWENCKQYAYIASSMFRRWGTHLCCTTLYDVVYPPRIYFAIRNQSWGVYYVCTIIRAGKVRKVFIGLWFRESEKKCVRPQI